MKITNDDDEYTLEESKEIFKEILEAIKEEIKDDEDK